MAKCKSRQDYCSPEKALAIGDQYRLSAPVESTQLVLHELAGYGADCWTRWEPSRSAAIRHQGVQSLTAHPAANAALAVLNRLVLPCMLRGHVFRQCSKDSVPLPSERKERAVFRYLQEKFEL